MKTLIIGGARSGKSAFALERASRLGGDKAFIATAQASDREMAARIAIHRQERGNQWTTFEEPLAIPALIESLDRKYPVLLLDCLTLWLSNLLLADGDTDGEIASLLSVLDRLAGTLFIVSNEVGQGIVPDNPLARRFRDISGEANRRLAAAADEVYLITAGIPLRLK